MTLNKTEEEQMREAFEYWAVDNGLPIDRCAEGCPCEYEYRNTVVQDSWIVWQEATTSANSKHSAILEDRELLAKLAETQAGEIAQLQKQVTCDHDWEFQDDSFDHEFGTEQVHYWMCEKCGATRPMEAGDYDYE